MSIRKTYPGKFEGTVALEAVQAEKTMRAWATQSEVHPNQMKQWKNFLIAQGGDLFEDTRRKHEKDEEKFIAE